MWTSLARLVMQQKLPLLPEGVTLSEGQDVKRQLDRCRAAFPDQSFDLNIIKTTGDKLQTASLHFDAAFSDLLQHRAMAIAQIALRQRRCLPAARSPAS